MRHVRVAAAEYYQPVAEGEERVVRARGRRAPSCGDHLRPDVRVQCVFLQVIERALVID